MAIGKGNKKGRKGTRKKIIEPMTRKDWYDVQVPATFRVRKVGKTLVNRTAGLKTATDSLIGRVFECNLADLNKDESVSFRKMRFTCEEVQGNTLLTNFHGMDLTRDKLCSLVKKWHTLVEAWCDVKTTDGYVLRMFCIGFTKRRHKQVSKTSYAQGGHVRAIRRKMIEIMTNKASKCDMHKLVSEFIPESIGHDIMVACNSIYPLNNVFIRKCKVLRKPKFDLAKLLDVHEGGAVGDGAVAEEEALVEELEGTGGRL